MKNSIIFQKLVPVSSTEVGKTYAQPKNGMKNVTYSYVLQVPS